MPSWGASCFGKVLALLHLRAHPNTTRIPVEQAAGDKMAFVIVRPGGLKSEPATGTGVLTGAEQASSPCDVPKLSAYPAQSFANMPPAA